MAIHESRWGAEFDKPGWIAILGQGRFHHCFGGSKWKAVGPLDVAYGPPTLILTLDMNDPRLSELGIQNVSGRQLPLFSYVNGMVGDVQHYAIGQASRMVTFIEAKPLFEKPEPLAICPNPLPARSIDLRPMTKDELPTNEAAYGKACDTFVGGDGWLRVGGAPIWLQGPESRFSQRGVSMSYVAAIGYNVQTPSPFLDEPDLLMFGEMAFYFFVSEDLTEVTVTMQST